MKASLNPLKEGLYAKSAPVAFEKSNAKKMNSRRNRKVDWNDNESCAAI
jgi:hypothetical protein